MSNLAFCIQAKENDKSLFGFWVYLMTDCVLFASLFATYAVLRNNTYGGPPGADLFNLKLALVETLILLTSSFSCGLAMMALSRQKTKQLIWWLSLTFLLGLVFLVMELSEFRHLVVTGNSWRLSGFLSAFFTLVGTHGLHITIGLIWMLLLTIKIISSGSGSKNKSFNRQLTMLGLYWHFLDIIWIFIFSIVYLIGAVRL